LFGRPEPERRAEETGITEAEDAAVGRHPMPEGVIVMSTGG
jgi:hypothetical protein